MLGLIKKDLLLIKGNLKAIRIILIVLVGVSFFQDMNLIFVPSFISLVLFLSTFSYDEYNKWDSYAITFPNGRKNVVGAKYVATLILLLISFIIATILSVGIGIFRNQWNIVETFAVMGGSIMGIILLIAIMYPIIFKFGNEKGRIAMFVIAFLGVTLFTLLLKSGKISKNIVLLEQYGIVFLVAICAIMLFVSYLLSKHIYENKEF